MLSKSKQEYNFPLNAGFDADPENYHRLRDCWLNRRRQNFIATHIKTVASGTRVLELGCGTGWLLSRLASDHPHLQWTGIDPLAGYISFAERNTVLANLRFVVGTAETADQFLKPGFDVILSNDVLHHVSSQSDVIQSMFRLAAPGCRWLAIEPNCRNVYTFLRQATKHGERNFWPASFGDTARKSGWTKMSQSYLFLVPPFVKEPPDLLVRLEKRFERQSLIAGGVCLELRKGS